MNLLTNFAADFPEHSTLAHTAYKARPVSEFLAWCAGQGYVLAHPYLPDGGGLHALDPDEVVAVYCGVDLAVLRVERTRMAAVGA